MKTLHPNISLILLAAAVVVVQSNPNVAPQVIYQKLEDALIADMQRCPVPDATGVLPISKFVSRLGFP